MTGNIIIFHGNFNSDYVKDCRLFADNGNTSYIFLLKHFIKINSLIITTFVHHEAKKTTYLSLLTTILVSFADKEACIYPYTAQ
jgi:hypothetical protein